MKILHYATISALLVTGGCSSTYVSSNVDDGIYYSGRRSTTVTTVTTTDVRNSDAQALYERTQAVMSAPSNTVVYNTANTNDNNYGSNVSYSVTTQVDLNDEDDSYARRLRMFEELAYTRPSSSVYITYNYGGYSPYWYAGYSWWGWSYRPHYYSSWYWRWNYYSYWNHRYYDPYWS